MFCRHRFRFGPRIRVPSTPPVIIEENVDFDPLDDSPDDSVDQDRALALAKAALVLVRADSVNAERLLSDLVSARGAAVRRQVTSVATEQASVTVSDGGGEADGGAGCHGLRCVGREDPSRRWVPFSKSTPLRSSDTNDRTNLIILVNVLRAWRMPVLGGVAPIDWPRWA